MTALVKYKNQTEYSFYKWIRQYPESLHPADTERFLKFVRTVFAFHSTKWKDAQYFKQRVLKERPYFNEDILHNFVIIYEYLIPFLKIGPMPRSFVIEDINVQNGYYIERGIKNGKFYEKQIKR